MLWFSHGIDSVIPARLNERATEGPRAAAKN
jgi:hypothetical protein